MTKMVDDTTPAENGAPDARRFGRSTFNSDETRKLIKAFGAACALLDDRGVAYNRIEVAKILLQLARDLPLDEDKLARSTAGHFIRNC